MDEIINASNFSDINLVLNIDLLSSITFAFVILLAGFTVGRLVGIIVFKILKGIEFDKTLKKSNLLRKLFLSKSISSFISWIIYIISVILALVSLNILYEAFIVIAYFTGVIFIGSLILGLVFSIPNLIRGFKLKRYNLVGKIITIKNVKGKVIKTGLFNIKLTGPQGELFIVPNRAVKNFSLKDDFN